jgi:hypothetical protein
MFVFMKGRDEKYEMLSDIRRNLGDLSWSCFILDSYGLGEITV